MRSLHRAVWTSVLVALAAWAGVTPSQVSAACGGDRDPHALARYAAKHADAIVLARLTAFDAVTGYQFEVLAAYRGRVTSPIAHEGVVDVGACSDQRVQAGERFVYAFGERNRFGPMRLLFPHVPGKGWVIDHWGTYATLDTLLGLLGVLPNTATAASPPNSGVPPASVWLALLGITVALARGLRRPARPSSVE